MLAPSAIAQTTIERRVIHLWVDPLHGSDELAAGAPGIGNEARNPQPLPTPSIGACLGSPDRPNNVRGAPALSGPETEDMRHAPYSFKTINAAVAYIRASQPGQPLPYTGQAITDANGDTLRVDWVAAIIHLLPGVYGATGVDEASGLPRNGEEFPIELPPFVSLQGTSALNTVLDAGGELGPILRFGRERDSGDGTFVNAITLTGVNADLADTLNPALPAETACAVYLSPQFDSNPTFTNCFITRNSVGVVVAAPQGASRGNGDEPAENTHDGTTFVNNTFARNGIGLWNGSLPVSETVDQFFVGFAASRLMLLNNIFDSTLNESAAGPPACDEFVPATSMVRQRDATRTYTSCFEGVSQEDLAISVGSSLRDYNAYEYVQDSEGGLLDAPFNVYTNPLIPPATSQPDSRVFRDVPETVASDAATSVTAQTNGAINLAPLTGENGRAVTETKPRGIVYVHDLFCAESPDGLLAQTPTGHDLSPHDFRLSPQTRLAPGVGDPNGRNRLVDRGPRHLFGRDFRTRLGTPDTGRLGGRTQPRARVLSVLGHAVRR